MKKTNKKDMPKTAVSILVWIILGAVLFGLVWVLFCVSLGSDVNAIHAADVLDYAEFYGSEAPGEGVGRMEQTTAQAPAASGVTADVLDYTHGVLWGWDGRYCELWEMELFARIMYLEFWGTSPECCEAGVDSVLRLWESGYFSDSLGGTLSAQNEGGGWVYSTYAYVWDWQYDAAGLADMKALCVERFTNGPEWSAPFFQLGGYPAWACPMYQVDGVYFSTGWGWTD